MSFPDATFDVILSNLCLHNIYDAPTRREALHQIVHELKQPHFLHSPSSTRAKQCNSYF